MLRPTWGPFTDVIALRDQINRLFDESVSRGPGREGMARRGWTPAVDIFEDNDSITLKMDLPGIQQSDIQVELEGETLTIRGERTLDDQESPNCLRAERVSGPFMRTFTLATQVQADRVTAQYRDGVLMVTIPKAEETKPRRIEISASA